jgi:hypothetical protein
MHLICPNQNQITMLPEKEIELEQKRVNEEIKNAVAACLTNLNWSTTDLSKARCKGASTVCEFVYKQGNYETNTLVDNCYYLGHRVRVIVEPWSFQGYVPQKKEGRKQ